MTLLLSSKICLKSIKHMLKILLSSDCHSKTTNPPFPSVLLFTLSLFSYTFHKTFTQINLINLTLAKQLSQSTHYLFAFVYLSTFSHYRIRMIIADRSQVEILMCRVGHFLIPLHKSEKFI